MQTKISIIIPVFNEEKTIEKALKAVLKQKSVGEVIAVNDGSSDASGKILKKIKLKNKKLKVFSHRKNQGKGVAVRTGLSKVSLDYFLIQDADLEYDPNDYAKLIKKISGNTAVFGSRLITRNAHAYQRTYLGNVLITEFCNFLFGTNLTDTYTCYKLLNTRLARELKLSSKGFELEAEITGKLAKLGIPIVEVPISFKPRKYEEGKKIKAKDAFIGAFTFLKIKLGILN